MWAQSTLTMLTLVRLHKHAHLAAGVLGIDQAYTRMHFEGLLSDERPHNSGAWML